MELVLFQVSLLLNLLALAANLIYLWRRPPLFEKIWPAILALACAAHIASFGIRIEAFWNLYEENRYFLPINTFFGALSYLSLITNLICLALAWGYGISVQGAIVLPLSLLAQAGVWIWADPALTGLVPALQSYWINIHPLILMGAYGGLANAFGVSAAYLIQEWQIKSRRPLEFIWQIPSLEVLDRLSYKMIFIILPVLTIGITMGGIWAWGAWGRFWGWDAKETWALITWMIYVIYLHLRLVRGWQGRSAVWINFIGFASVLFTFFGVNFLSRLHGYLSG